MNYRTVYELIEGVKNDALRGRYAGVMRLMRALLLDIKKNRANYPAEIETLKTFVLLQLRRNMELLAPGHGAMAQEFRRLAENAVLCEVMQDIYMADCRAAREAASLRLNKLRGQHEKG